MTQEQSLYTLAELEGASGVPARRIRTWIKAGVLPSPYGMGPGPHYGAEHLERIQFIERLPIARIPVGDLRDLFESLPRETIQLVASGREDVTAAALAGMQPPARRGGSTPSPARKRPPSWTTIQIQDGLELRMRGDEPDQVAWLAHLARHLREWVAQQE